VPSGIYDGRRGPVLAGILENFPGGLGPVQASLQETVLKAGVGDLPEWGWPG